MFITAGELLSPRELYAKLGPESRLVLLQHHAPIWSPPEHVTTPLLWVAAEKDGLISCSGAQRTASFYNATYTVAEGAGHDVMIEASAAETARQIHVWLTEHGIE